MVLELDQVEMERALDQLWEILLRIQELEEEEGEVVGEFSERNKRCWRGNELKKLNALST